MDYIILFFPMIYGTWANQDLVENARHTIQQLALRYAESPTNLDVADARC